MRGGAINAAKVAWVIPGGGADHETHDDKGAVGAWFGLDGVGHDKEEQQVGRCGR